MTDELKHECAVAMVVLRKPPCATGDFGGTKLSLLLEKQHNRGQDGAGAAILSAKPEPGEKPYWISKSASSTPLADLLAAIGKRDVKTETFPRIFLGHLRYATFGKNEVAFCHPFVHESSELAHTLLLAGNFNLTNAGELFDDYSKHGSFPTSKADGYLICEMIAKRLSSEGREGNDKALIASSLNSALASADGAWTLCGSTGDSWAFATRDPHGIRPGFYYVSDDVVSVASERPAIQAAFDVPPDAVKEIPPGSALVISPEGEIGFVELDIGQPATGKATAELPDHQAAKPIARPCSFERIYFSRANDADIHRERKALGANLVPQILKAAEAPFEDIFFSYIPNSARIAFHGLLEELFALKRFPRFGEIAVKDAKFRTFIADAAARREFYKHVYDVTYGLVRAGKDTLVVLDDSIVRGNTMKNAILPMLDRLGPKRIVIVSSAPPIRYPDCYGIDMSTLGELVAFKALVNLLDGERGTGTGERNCSDGDLAVVSRKSERLLKEALESGSANPLAALYAHFTDEQHCTEIARLLTPPGMKAEVKVVYQTVENMHKALAPAPGAQIPAPRYGDWYFTGDYPTAGGYKVLEKALNNYIERRNERSY